MPQKTELLCQYHLHVRRPQNTWTCRLPATHAILDWSTLLLEEDDSADTYLCSLHARAIDYLDLLEDMDEVEITRLRSGEV